ncbi:MAG: glutamate--tRNA ligase [Rikenellaceae bacterium]
MVRVRFAPSPTGALHIGGVRTALYNYLFARHHGGKMLLRIEDTDSQRFVEGAEDYIVESLKWCGIEIDEGVGVGGEHAPYRQSERRELYLKYALELVEKGWAYYAFDTAEELSAIRAEKEAAHSAFAYNYSVRESLATSLRLSAEDVAERIAAGEQYVIRFKMPEGEEIVMQDMVRGEVRVNSSTLDDKVLYKSHDQLPTYHLANIVDDHLMEISHVIRGEEWLPSLPLHFMLYRAFGWERPEFAHLPLILKPDGKGKLSKRDGDRLGFAVFPLQWTPKEGDGARGFREDGYLPEAFINMLALLGWNPGDNKEVMSMQEMIELFSIDRIGKSGARYDPDKARWFNAEYAHSMDDAALAVYLKDELATRGVAADDTIIYSVSSLIKPRVVLLTELWDLAHYFFLAPTEFDAKVVKKFFKGDNPSVLSEICSLLEGCEDFTRDAMHEMVCGFLTARELPMGPAMNLLRMSMVGGSGGPDIFSILEVLGRCEVVSRIKFALNHLSVE